MTAALRELIAAVAGPREWSDTRESWLARAARKAGISYRQTKSLWYGEIQDETHRSARLMRDAAERLAQRYEAIIASERAKAGVHKLSTDRAALIRIIRALRDLA